MSNLVSMKPQEATQRLEVVREELECLIDLRNAHRFPPDEANRYLELGREEAVLLSLVRS